MKSIGKTQQPHYKLINLSAKTNNHHHKPTKSIGKKPIATTTNQEVYWQKPITTTTNPQNIINRERERVRDSQKSKKKEIE
jgi:hypothetical protein